MRHDGANGRGSGKGPARYDDDAYGQWQPHAGDAVVRLNSRVIVLLHDPTAASLARLDALRSAWKRISGDDSVLRAMQAVEVSF